MSDEQDKLDTPTFEDQFASFMALATGRLYLVI